MSLAVHGHPFQGCNYAPLSGTESTHGAPTSQSPESTFSASMSKAIAIFIAQTVGQTVKNSHSVADTCSAAHKGKVIRDGCDAMTDKAGTLRQADIIRGGVTAGVKDATERGTKAPAADTAGADSVMKKSTQKPEDAAAEKARINAETMQGIGNHPMGPDDKLLPPGDKRSAQEILDSPEGKILKNLGNQEGIRDRLKEAVGDFNTDPDAAARGIAYLRKIKNMPGPEGPRSEGMRTSDSMDGVTKDGDVRAGTEMAMLKDSLKGGPHISDDSVRGKPVDRDAAYKYMNEQKALAPTNDKHVKNGENIVSDAKVIGSDILEGLGKVFGGMLKIFGKLLSFIPGVGKIFGKIGETAGALLEGGLNSASRAAIGDTKGADIAGKQGVAKATGSLVDIAPGMGPVADIVEKKVNESMGSNVKSPVT